MYWHNLPVNIKLIYIILGGFLMEKILSNYKSLLNNLESLSSESINNYDLDKTG